MPCNSNKNMKLQSLAKQHRSISLSCFVFILLSQSPQFGVVLTTICVMTAGFCLLYSDIGVRRQIIEVANDKESPE